MVLKQVHDTNMRAKGHPERVFSVSRSPPRGPPRPSLPIPPPPRLSLKTAPTFPDLSHHTLPRVLSPGISTSAPACILLL